MLGVRRQNNNIGNLIVANALLLPGPGSAYQQSGAEPAGFWDGFWHGFICPITFIISLFNSSVRIYEQNNRGRWYDFGFVLGSGFTIGGGSHSPHIIHSITVHA
jgi:hypothetical protein